MDLKTKQKFDNIVGHPLLLLLNLAARILGFLLRRSHERLPANRILIMKFQGMGSLALAKPALRTLREDFPEAEIIFWGTPGTTCLARLMPEFDHVLELNDKSLTTSFLSLLQNLLYFWTKRIDWAFDLEVYSKLSSILTTATLARNRAGFAVEPVRARRNVHTHLMMFNRYWYLGDAYARLIGMLTKKAIPDSPVRKEREWNPQMFGDWKFELQPPEKSLNSSIKGAALQSKKYLVLNIHSGPLALERRWPIQHFLSLSQRYLNHFPEEQIVLIGHGKDEVKRSENFLNNSRVHSLAGRISLEETISLLAHSSLVISNDTAALHLALTTKVPVIGLFGPTRAKSYFPSWRPNGIAITRDFYCSPCVHHWSPPPCGGINYCMFAITVASVERAIVELKKNNQDLPDKGKALAVDKSEAIESSILQYYEQGLVNHPDFSEEF